MNRIFPLAHFSVLDKPAVARSELQRSEIEAVSLEPDPDWNPERHVNIIGWPAAEDEIAALALHLFSQQNCVKQRGQRKYL